jgi:hypothetical protein
MSKRVSGRYSINMMHTLANVTICTQYIHTIAIIYNDSNYKYRRLSTAYVHSDYIQCATGVHDVYTSNYYTIYDSYTCSIYKAHVIDADIYSTYKATTANEHIYNIYSYSYDDRGRYTWYLQATTAAVNINNIYMLR